MNVKCPECGKKYDFDEAHLAQGSIKVRCPNCKHDWVIKAQSRKIVARPEAKEVAIDHALRERDMKTAIPKLLPIEDLITIRAIVGFLGEKPQFGWWDTNFLSETGLKFLNITFPRTAFSAGVNSVTEAAKRLHDSRIGKGQVYHLFRMPEFLEQRIHKRISNFESSSLMPSLKAKEIALEKLQAMTDEDLEAQEGPIQVGKGRALLQLSSLKRVAKYYAHAFENGKQAFPYFTDF